MSSPAAVAKPTNAGTGVNAIIQTTSAFANLRNGPGTQYTDIGDLRDNSLVIYYPKFPARPINGIGWSSAACQDGSRAAWQNLKPLLPRRPPTNTQTPYDGKVAVWHWKGESLPEKTIEEYVANLKRRAPNVKMVFVKTSDGADWMANLTAALWRSMARPILRGGCKF
ncbi:MAG: hypothetical protein HC788_15220 [Sphingopyxis sp.]|nr:hypothetical protein [Sphingopyxis sp.]